MNSQDLSKLSKSELLSLCENSGLLKFKSKNKQELIDLLTSNNNTERFDIQRTLKPLIKWSGGKADEIEKIKHHIPSDYNVYLEPFVGGGALYFHLNPKNAVINDVHTELIALYQSIAKGHSQDIYDFMKQHPNDEATYYKIRDSFEINDTLDIAKRFYYQRKTCFRGMLRYNSNGGFNIPFGRYKTISFDDLLDRGYYELLSRTTIMNSSFEEVFENYNDRSNFMFLDPPYDSVFTDYGYCQFGKDEHIKLSELFKSTKIRCLMVIGDTPFIREIYDGFIVEEYDKAYKFKIHSGRIGDDINTKHLVIKNY